MRVAVIGKGGSGKTSISTALVKYSADNYTKLLAVDADVNAHLGEYIGFGKVEKHIGDEFTPLADYLFKNKPKGNYPIIGTIPPTLDSNFIRLSEVDPILNEYAKHQNNVFYLSTGTYKTEDLGDSCFHAKLNSLELFMHHLLDKEDELVVIDSAAGIDTVATSMFIVPDITFFVVEPTNESLSVYQDYLDVLKDRIDKYKLKVVPIVNKVEDEADLDFVKAKLKTDEVISFSFDKNLIRFEQGDHSSFSKFLEKHAKQIGEMDKLIRQQVRDYDNYYQAVLDIFRSECNAWANKTFGGDFSNLIDANFSYQKLTLTQNV